MQRGAEMYDLFMAMRYERDEAKELGCWSRLCAMAMHFKEQDDVDERVSTFTPKKAMQNTAKYGAKHYRIR